MLVCDFLGDRIGIAQVQAGENFTVGVLTVQDVETGFQIRAEPVFGRFHFRLIDCGVIPTRWDCVD